MNKFIENRKRRQFIKSALVSGSVLPLSSSLFANTIYQKNAFIVPPLDRGNRKGNHVTFDLSINAGKSAFFRGLNTNTVGINQSYLGPVLRAKRGDIVNINVT